MMQMMQMMRGETTSAGRPRDYRVLTSGTMACMRSLSFTVAVAGLALLAPQVASAAGEACYRDTECVGAELCLAGVCTAAEVQSCSTADDCDDDDAGCADGFCKVEGVTCQNPAGACWVRDGGGLCECGNGDGSGWGDGFNPDDPPEPPTDDDLLASCQANLVESCGEDPPALPDSCTGQVLEDCEALIDREDEFSLACGEEAPAIDIARVGRCCDDYEDEMSAAYRECVLALEVEGCSDALGECESDVGGEPASGEDTQEGEQSGDDDTTGRGCAIAGEREGTAWLAGLAAVLAFGATRRRAWR
jgi:hypothetical protein